MKSIITLNTSTSYPECDRMFISDFLHLDDAIATHVKNKHEAMDNVLSGLN